MVYLLYIWIYNIYIYLPIFPIGSMLDIYIYRYLPTNLPHKDFQPFMDRFAYSKLVPWIGSGPKAPTKGHRPKGKGTLF